MLLNSGIYQNHIVDMNGIVRWSTDIEPLSTDSVIGKSIEDILYYGDACAARGALFRAATGHNYQWYKYAIKDDVFLALIEFIPDQYLFSIHEARMTGSRDVQKYKNFLLATSGCFKHLIKNDESITIPANSEMAPYAR